MKLLDFQRKLSGKYLHTYELTYENKAGRSKKYEMVSRRAFDTPEQLGNHLDGLSIAATMNGKLLLLREFRMAVNREIYNLCAGMIEENETIEQCIKRELYEETGLQVKEILAVLPPAFSAVGISDVKTVIAFVEVEGELADHSSQNEQIEAAFYTKEEVRKIIYEEEMSDRAQMVAYQFLCGCSHNHNNC